MDNQNRNSKGQFKKGNQAAKKTEEQKKQSALSRAELTKKRKEQIALTREGVSTLAEEVLEQIREKLKNNELSASDLVALYPRLLNYILPKLKQEELIDTEGDLEGKEFTIKIVRNREEAQKIKKING